MKGSYTVRWLVMPFVRYADFKGRSGRTEFWTFFGLSIAVFLFAVIATGLSTESTTVAQPKASGANASPVGAIAYMFWWIVSVVPWFALQVRRFHDQGRSGWFCLVGAGAYVAVGFGAVPLAAVLALIAVGLMALPGEGVENRFGLPIESVDDFEAVAAGQDSLSANALPVHFETTALPPSEAFATLETHPEIAEHRQEIRPPEIPVMADAESASSQEAPWSAPASSDKNRSEHHESSTDLPSLPDGVTITADGRYSCGGYVFNLQSAAISYSQRRSTPVPALRNANSSELDDNRPQRNALDQSRESEESTLHQFRPSSDSHEIPDASELGDDEDAYNLATIGAMPPYLPDDVKLVGNGRYSCGGYTFSSLEQALSFAKRRSDRGGHSEVSAAPFSSTPVPKPPQPSPPKVERSSFFGFGSSARKQDVAEYWVAAPSSLSAGGVPFEGHLVYFGTRSRQQQYERHRSLIDPKLDVSNGRDPEGSTFSYWPNYSELRPEARRSYLEWLTAGRSDPNTPIGYVFIYFYSLERRLVKDRSEADAPAIIAELRRLLVIYGHNHSFKNYCSALLDLGEVLFGDEEGTPTPTLDNRYGWEVPIRLRVHLGKKIAAGLTLDSNDALCWTLGHPSLYPRTPVTRCFPEFCELWKVRFDEQFPKGLSIREPKARLNFQYRSASSEFNATATVDDLPDVAAISGPISKFDFLLGTCSDELDPLSRFLGRNPAEKESAIAGALLPEPLRENCGQSSFSQFSQFLGIATERTGFAEVSIPEIMAKLGFPNAAKSDERRALHLKRLPELMDAAGFGFEPDKRFGPAPSPSEDLKLCVFRAEQGGAVNANRPEYQAARTMAEIAALAARADDHIVEAEIDSITADLLSFPDISDLDRSRLQAHALALLANPTKLKAAIKRLCELPEEQRQAALTSAVRAVLADQRVTPSEVRFLEGLYKALGLPQDEVYSRLHSGEVTPKSASTAALPSKQGSGREPLGSGIDQEKLARLKEETSAVSSMLASIFKEDETSAKPADERPAMEAELAGLDLAHSELLILLTEAPLDSDSFAAICRDHKLLPSGAIETINDWAFDALDDYAIEEGEMICIQEHLIEPIRAMRKAR
jgi:uncharacterized membrane protein YhaH (DUF805 family)